MPQVAIISILFLLFLSLPHSSIAAKNLPKDQFELGKHYLEAGDYTKSYNIFQKAFFEDPANLDISFFMGLAAFKKGDYESALMAYDRILIMDPQANRVKLEIGRCYFALGSFETAKVYFYEVLETNPPDNVQQNIKNFLAAIAAAEKQHFISGLVAIEVGMDSNVRTAPNSDTLDLLIGSALYSFTPDPPVEDKIVNTTTSINHVYRFADSPYSWNTSLLNINSFYSDYKDLDLTLIGLSSGLVFNKNNYTIQYSGLFNDIDLAYDPYMRQLGFSTSISWNLDPNIILSAAAGLNKKRYAQDSDSEKDATNYNASVTPTLFIGPNIYSFALGKERENADIAHNSYDRFSATLRYDRNLPKDFSLFASLGIQLTDYDELKSGETAIRSDTIQNLSFGVNNTLFRSKDKFKIISLQLKHTYTESKSTVATYTYRKNFSSATFNFAF